MKKHTLSGFALIAGLFTFCTKAYSQITITYADLPYAGLTVVTEKDSTTSLVPGPKGAAQTWDFSSLKRQKAETIKFMTPAQSGYAAQFPSSNLADSTLGGNGYNFFDTSATSFAAEGAEEFVTAESYPFHVELNLSPTFVQSALPATYGSVVPPSLASGMEQFNVTFSVVVTGERFYDSITYNDTVDAWGTMKMPNGKTYEVLRQNHKEIDYENVYVDILSNWSSEERIVSIKNEYNWYAKGVGFILAEMDMDSTTSNVKDVIWDSTAPPPVNSSISEISFAGRTMVYPNPCKTIINFTSTDPSAQYLFVYDIAGRQLDRVEMKNSMTTLNTSMYSEGMYIYQLTDNSGALVDRGKFMVQK